MKDINSATKVTAIDASDQLLLSDGGTALAKIDYNVLAKAIIEQYTGSSVAGKAQSLKAALDTLNSKFDGNNIQFVNMSGSSGNTNNAIRFRGASESETTEHEYVMFGIGYGNRMFGFYAYIRYSSQTITVYSFGDIQCTGSISGDTAIIKVATWMKAFGIVRNKVASIDYTNVS